MEHRPQGKAGLIPAKAFEHERGFLTVVSGEIPAPYCSLERGTDPYGYVAVEGNYYWVPGDKREDVKVLRYAERLKIYGKGSCLAEYPLPPDGVKNARFSPEGQPSPRHLPKHRKDGSQHEEQRLRALGAEVAAYVDYALQTAGIQRHRFLRELYSLSRQVTLGVFVEALTRALRYRVTEMESLRRIAWFCMSQGQQPQPYVDLDVDEGFRQRPAYQEGCLTDEPDLSVYDEDQGSREHGNKEKDDVTGTESEDEHG